ncbi:hypothetical protein N7G274_005589 [Stereocaulon virgatum]|uniref:PPIase cyclophilin-type domain-containing protein n=1 Tax=Stereocaulon virgatum TaxID=373712 RepID=A0ABR4A9L9_9LECA
MSALYNLEPQPTAKVLLTTTSGDLSLELFAKQTPLASRNFLQLCLDGYYNGTIFHRLVPGFILQGGDPTETGHGGESIYPEGPFEDEFHSRLKFNRRGLLGMANAGKNDNGSQFFLTLGDTPELQGKHTMFGRVEGDTIYNLMKMGEAEMEAGEGRERPVYPTRITGAEILGNPFEEMVRREVKSKAAVAEKGEVKRKGKRKGGKTLLSFGGDEGNEGAEEPVLKKEKYNSTLVSASSDPLATKATDGGPKTSGKIAERPVRRRSTRSKSPPQLVKPEREFQLPLPNDEEPSRSPSVSSEPEQAGKMSTLLDKTNAQIAEMKASMKRNIQKAPALEIRKKSALEQMIPENSMRGRKRKHRANDDTPADKQTLDFLNAFKAKLEKAHPKPQPSESVAQNNQYDVNGHDKAIADFVDDEEAALCDLHFIINCQSCQSWDQQMGGDAEAHNDDSHSWMSHALSFERDKLGKDLTWKKKNEEELIVIDPREKEKTIREEQRAKKMARLGGRTTAWDRDREKGRAPDKRAGERGQA